MKNLRITLALAAAFAAFAVVPAHAITIDDGTFELDGNIVVTPNQTTTVDWASLFDVSGNNVPTAKTSQPAGFITSPVFIRDFTPGQTSDSTTYTTGSKDILNIGGGGWQCTKSNNISDKVDMLNAYATAQVHSVGGVDHVFVYFGMEVASNNGTKDVGFWFLKDQTVACVAGTHATNFTGTHTDGDLLVVSEFTKGGGVSTIKVFKWEGGASGALNTTPVVTGADCQGLGAGSICATVNGSPLLAGTDVPWLTQTKAGTGTTSADLDTGEFFEGGIDLTANGLQGCFSTFLADTRSSATPTATLFDFALGNFNLCGFSVGKACDTVATNNPHVLSDGSTLETQFDVSVANDGLSTLYDVRIHEDVTFGTGDSCRITAISGGINPTTVPTGGILIGSNSVTPFDQKVADSLGGGQTMHVTVVCDSPHSNPFLNSVTTKANPASDGSGTDISRSHSILSGTSEACAFTNNPALKVEKQCSTVNTPPVTLSLTGGATVCIDVVLTNNGVEDLKDISVVDNKAGTVVSGATLSNGGGTATYTKCYTTTSADSSTETDPGKITFSDQLSSVSFTGVVSGTTRTLTNSLPSAKCNLCPTCPTCP